MEINSNEYPILYQNLKVELENLQIRLESMQADKEVIRLIKAALDRAEALQYKRVNPL